MSKAILHNLVDLLNESDTDTIYNILIRFVPDSRPYEDEKKAIAQAEIDILNGDVVSLSEVNWNNI